ncbi:MAG: DNA-protecting protein DprA [Candidatus Nanoarchaeia archaeon]|nr:DNA-protecting protein DprA [Candidatus Nanoarchaeia archaeon]
MDNIEYWLAVSMMKGIGPSRLSEVYSSATSPEEMLKGQEILLEKSRKYLDYCDENKVKVMFCFDKEYPAVLHSIADKPKVIFTRGDIGLLEKPSLAIVGTRQPSEKAALFAKNIASSLSKSFNIVSGGAEGIDSMAHLGALEGFGKTICVLGSGFLNKYPALNNKMFDEIAEKGLLITEQAPDFVGNRFSLLQRNRITSALSKAVFVVASKETGGSMWQAELAWRQKRQIFVPSLSLGLEPSAGIKQLLEKGRAVEFDSVEKAAELVGK